MKNLFKRFTQDDVRQANSDVIDHRDRMTVELSPVSTRLLRQSHFSGEEINRAFAEARRLVNG